MFAIILPNGEICKNMKRILKEQEIFYKQLYTSDETIQFAVVNQTGTVISETDRCRLEEDISPEEVYKAANGLSRNKVGGVRWTIPRVLSTFLEWAQGTLI